MVSGGMRVKLLFVDACPRREASRTLALAGCLLDRLRERCPGLEITAHRLADMGLRSVDDRLLAEKEALCDALVWDHPLMRPAVDFREADAVVIAAPYWDLSFPSMLKVWVENMWVRNLTFFYRGDQPVGLARGRAAVYVTTSGSYTAGHDWGTLYIRDVMRTLGIGAFRDVKAEGLDLEGTDTDRILQSAREEARNAAEWLADTLRQGSEERHEDF